MPRAGRSNRELVVIYWRDIPAQVNAQEGRDRHQVVLGGKFQRAIDRAKRKAKIYTADEEVAQWRRESRAITGDLAAEAQAAADAIELEYRSERLGLLAYYGGWEADVVTTAAVDRDVLAALEELDDDETEQETM
ncbi:MAG TPA: virulence factor [Ilumatobacteraceae bacterium]|nr:virulence factor [Ilumatobacteraceae bacterium]